jgi:hypothetical protein
MSSLSRVASWYRIRQVSLIVILQNSRIVFVEDSILKDTAIPATFPFFFVRLGNLLVLWINYHNQLIKSSMPVRSRAEAGNYQIIRFLRTTITFDLNC